MNTCQHKILPTGLFAYKITSNEILCTNDRYIDLSFISVTSWKGSLFTLTSSLGVG
jgi:hypothetical protein